MAQQREVSSSLKAILIVLEAASEACDQNAVPLSSVPSGYPHALSLPHFPHKALESFLI